MLRQHGVAHCFNSWTYMSFIGQKLDVPGPVTAPFVVVRALMRPGRQYAGSAAAFEPFDKIQEPYGGATRSPPRLQYRHVEHVYVLLNKPLEGNAPVTVAALAELVSTRV